MANPYPFPSPVRLAGDGVRLREWTDDDLPAMVELFDEAEVARWTPLASPFDLAAATAYLARARTGRASGQRLQLAVTTDGRRPLGEVLLFGREPGGPTEELGYSIGVRHRRQGLARGALVLLTRYAHRELGLQRVVLRIEPANVASEAVARSAGFRRTEEPPMVNETNGGWIVLHTWAHLAE
ncbi:GNAT family N-acetyltransferase [Micromonospora sp. NPDC050417]|uniref:GNAT family N-acetyltransferase n=1 Tax=Micromonospora sp. NPDC050417 TaxID=3364280 RepID=UPI0037B20518